MKVATAVALVFLGAALRLMQSGRKARRPVARFLAAFSGLIAIVVLLEYACGVPATAFDQILIPLEGLRLPVGQISGRMAPNTALTILIGAIALFFLDDKEFSRNRAAHGLTMLMMASGIWTLLCFMFDSVAYFHATRYSGMALNTAVAFVVFGVGILFTRPGSGAMAIFSRDSASGAMARAILPTSILMLIALGAATALGMRTGLYDGSFQNALFTQISIILFTLLVWRTAHGIDTTERRADEMHRQVSRQYVTMAEAIPQIVWTADADGSVNFFNKRWFDYTGLALAESKGLLWQTALHPDDGMPCGERWRHSVSSGSGFEMEARIRQHDGGMRWHLIRALPVKHQSGDIDQWFGTCTDIDDRKRAEESLRFLADASTLLSASLKESETLNAIAQLAVPKTADFCSVHLMLDGRLQLAAVSHMDPKKVDLIIGIDNEFSPGEAIADVAVSGKAALMPEIGETELGLLAIDDAHRAVLRELRLVSLICVPLPGHSDTLGVITFASTEDGRRYGEPDLALAEELGRRTALALDNNRLFEQLSETKVEAETANAAKDQFLAVLSHELRTPLTPVLLCVEDLCRDNTLPPPVHQAMEMTRRNIELEARMIDDLLDLTRIVRGKLQLERVLTDVHALLRNSIEICNADIRAKNLCISLGFSALANFVYADPARLQQVFWNLIKNAVKFTPPNGTIIFRSRNVPNSRGTGLQIEVEDSGIGIDAAFLPNIFNAFEQGEKSRSRRFGGLGLGLAITKNLVEAHGGTISVNSPGRDLGTRFTIDLDTVEPGASNPGAAMPKSDAPRAHGIRILLVEDNHETGILLRKILERRGYQVDLATTMQAGLDAAGKASFDLLLSDVGLPDGSGLELMKRLRETRILPGIAMSGFGMDEDIHRSREAGFEDHLTKPISIAKLEEAIEKVAEKLVRR